jgi:hypothetical protein
MWSYKNSKVIFTEVEENAKNHTALQLSLSRKSNPEKK